MTVVNTVSGKEKVRVPSPSGMALTGDKSSPHSLWMTWTRGWYLCMEWRMIWTRRERKINYVFPVGFLHMAAEKHILHRNIQEIMWWTLKYIQLFKKKDWSPYMSLVIQLVVGQFEFVETDHLTHPGLSWSRGVWVDVDPGGHGGVCVPCHHPFGAVVDVPSPFKHRRSENIKHGFF